MEILLITVALVGTSLVLLSYVLRKTGWEWLRAVMSLVVLLAVVNLAVLWTS